jgi:integrase
MNRYGRPFTKLDLKKQVQVIIDELGKWHLHREKFVSLNTVKARAYIVHQFFNDVRKAGYAVTSVLNLSQKHIAAAVQKWAREGLSASTIQTRMSILRWLAEAVSKPGMVTDATDYGLTEEAVARTYVAQEDKSWTSHEVLPKEKIKEIYKLDVWVGIQLEMASALGLRVAEAIMMRPALCHLGDMLRIDHGTKGGRTRLVEVRTVEQAEILSHAKEIAQKSPRGSLCPPGKKLAQAKNRLYYICRKVGVTKDQLGVTAHGLRHQYANDRFEEIAGQPSAVRGGQVVDRERNRRARHQVTQDLGHARLSITTAYTGPRPKGRPRGSGISWN